MSAWTICVLAPIGLMLWTLAGLVLVLLLGFIGSAMEREKRKGPPR